MDRFKPIPPDVFDKVFQELLEGKAPKTVGFNNNVSKAKIQMILDDHPLFFGLRRPYVRHPWKAKFKKLPKE